MWPDDNAVTVTAGRVLTECEAKRAIVELHTPLDDEIADPPGPSDLTTQNGEDA